MIKQKARGPHCLPEKPVQIFKAIIISQCWLAKEITMQSSPFFQIIKWSLFVKPWAPFIQGCFVPSLFEIDPMVLERIILRFRHFIFSILKKRVALHLNKIEFSSPKDIFCQVWLKSAQWFLRRIFLNFVHVFSLFRNYLPLEKCIALHLNKLNLTPFTRGCFAFIHPRMFCI